MRLGDSAWQGMGRQARQAGRLAGRAWLATTLVCAWWAAWAGVAPPVRAEGFEDAPVNYSTATPDNRVERLNAELAAGGVTLNYEPHFGYLRSFLAAVEVDPASQMLVFSKTSLQRDRISPSTPRALYFSDDMYVGFCSGGTVLEVSAADPKLGTVFYTLEQTADRPRITRQTDNCMICHSSTRTHDVPGHLVRSLYVEPSGQPLLSEKTYHVDQTVPLEHRWGGWYVTGTHGRQKHLGNLIVETPEEARSTDNAAGQNVTSLEGRIDCTDYLQPHSDLVALLVLEHQADAHNLLTRANFATQQALHYQSMLNRELKESAEHEWESTRTRIVGACEPLVEYLLMSGEAKLTEPVTGTSEFAAHFQERGPRDRRGRSLRELDLTRRLFKYPCSYLVYSPSFEQLPPRAKDYVLGRLREILEGRDKSAKFAHLSAADRQAIHEILSDTLPGFAG